MFPIRLVKNAERELRYQGSAGKPQLKVKVVEAVVNCSFTLYDYF